MATKLEVLNAVASPGKLYATDSEDYETYEFEQELNLSLACGAACRPSYTVSTDEKRAGWNTDSGYPDYCISKENAEFIAELWNLYREGKLVEVDSVRSDPDKREVP